MQQSNRNRACVAQGKGCESLCVNSSNSLWSRDHTGLCSLTGERELLLDVFNEFVTCVGLLVSSGELSPETLVFVLNIFVFEPLLEEGGIVSDFASLVSSEYASIWSANCPETRAEI